MRAGQERQQQKLEMGQAAVFCGRGEAGDRRQCLFGHGLDDLLDLAAGLGVEQCAKAPVLPIANPASPPLIQIHRPSELQGPMILTQRGRRWVSVVLGQRMVRSAPFPTCSFLVG